ncbi:Nuclease SbcCD subunit D [compost metagenome]
MKALCYADFHGHLFTDFMEVDEITGNSRFTQQLEAMDFMKNYCLENGIEYCLFAGDLYHKRRTTDQMVKNKLRDKVKEMGEAGIVTIMIPGNHDQVDNSDYPDHSLHSFRELKNVTLLDRFEPLFIQDDEDVFIYPVPYSKNAAMVKDFLNDYAKRAKADKSCSHILLGHLGVSGAFVGKGNYPMADAFSVEDLHPDAFDFGVFGHFHRQQFLGGHPHFFYCGSPLEHSFSDEGEDRGFVVIDTLDKTVERVPIPAPKFITAKVKSAEDIKTIEHLLKGNFYRIQVDADSVESVLDSLPPDAKYRIEAHKEYVEERRVDIDATMSMSQIVTNYSNQFNPDALDIGLEILREVEEGL